MVTTVDIRQEERVSALLDHFKDDLREMRDALGDQLQERHTDTWLLRYLVGSSVEKAITRFEKLLEWRRKHSVDKIEDEIRGGKQPHDFPFSAAVLAFFPQLLHHFTSFEGMPVSYDFYGMSDVVGLMKSLGSENFAEYCRWKVEYVRIQLEDIAQKEGLFKREMVIADLAGIGRKHVHMPFLQSLKTVSKFMEEMYREQVGRVVCLNANHAFTLCWKFIRPALNARTLEKVSILGRTESKKQLPELVPQRYIPMLLHGDCSCSECCQSNEKPATSRSRSSQLRFNGVEHGSARYAPYVPRSQSASRLAAMAGEQKRGRLSKMVSSTVKTVKKPFKILREGARAMAPPISSIGTVGPPRLLNAGTSARRASRTSSNMSSTMSSMHDDSGSDQH